MRHVSARIEAEVVEPCDLVLAIAVADGPEHIEEHLTFSVGQRQIEFREINGPHGGRLHVAGNVPPGSMTIDYRAAVTGFAEAPAVDPLGLIEYGRPSRYCESDRLAGFAQAQFAGFTDTDLLLAVSSWVGTNIRYVPGSSRPIDGAVATMLAREGVCRDEAHLVVALLRACDMPARVVSVYAPGLSPMDFHAVAEAYVEGGWHVVDSTCLAPRGSLVRIATGRDAADTAFLTSTRGAVCLSRLQVTAVITPTLPADDLDQLVTLG